MFGGKLRLAPGDELAQRKQKRAMLRRESRLQKLASKNQRSKTRQISDVVTSVRFNGATRLRRVTIIATASAFLALAALVVAAVFSPMLAVERIAVRGQKLVSQSEIKKALKDIVGKPLPQVNADELASKLKKFSLIESISVISLPPHTLMVRITERTPIVIVWVDGFGYAYFDPAGVRVGRATNQNSLPVLRIWGTPGKSPSFKAAIDVLMALPAKLLPQIQNVTAKSKDDVTFQLRGYAGQRVIWGDSSDAVLKSKVLAALLKNQSKSDRVTYDVSSPTAPVVRYR
jgi:cell division protein FtsQ